MITGNIRYRSHLHTPGYLREPTVLLVLQVEEKYPDGANDHNGLPTHLAGTRWRDARVEDLPALKGLT